MKAAEHQVAFWPYPQLLLAAHFQSPLGDLDHLADVRDVKQLIRLLLHRHAKPAHDQLVLPPCHAVPASSALGEAANHCLYQLMLQPTRDIGIADDFRGVLSQLPGHRILPDRRPRSNGFAPAPSPIAERRHSNETSTISRRRFPAFLTSKPSCRRSLRRSSPIGTKTNTTRARKSTASPSPKRFARNTAGSWMRG